MSADDPVVLPDSAVAEERPTFGSTVRDHRARLGMSITDLAQRILMDPGLLSKIERGLRPPPQDYLIQKIAEAFQFAPAGDPYETLMKLAASGRMRRRRKLVIRPRRVRRIRRLRPPTESDQIVTEMENQIFAVGLERQLTLLDLDRKPGRRVEMVYEFPNGEILTVSFDRRWGAMAESVPLDSPSDPQEGTPT